MDMSAFAFSFNPGHQKNFEWVSDLMYGSILSPVVEVRTGLCLLPSYVSSVHSMLRVEHCRQHSTVIRIIDWEVLSGNRQQAQLRVLQHKLFRTFGGMGYAALVMRTVYACTLTECNSTVTDIRSPPAQQCGQVCMTARSNIVVVICFVLQRSSVRPCMPCSATCYAQQSTCSNLRYP